MTFTFKRATRDPGEPAPIIILLAGGTGSGKSFTGDELATGLAGGKPFAVVDTEAGRARHYSSQFVFDHGDLKPPFTPDRYLEAILAAEEARYPVVVVDSASHEWSGEGGCLDWHEQELQRMAGDDWKKREACAMAAWIKVKASHKHFVSRLLQLRCHLILALRAEEKIDMVRNQQTGKMEIVPKRSAAGFSGWLPICEKNLPFEAMASFLLMADAPGVPHPIKLMEQHKAFFPLDKPINRKCGELLAAWAAGGVQVQATAGMSLEKIEMHVDTMTNSTTLAELEAAFGAAWKAAKKDSPERARFQDVYNGMKEALGVKPKAAAT